ncbi:MAG: AraC family transcriptional regulator [Bacteroidales bacterium]|jgi:AraC-like DNA-binding protein|nr:AraC family transcriptional regulator [Bacteroidales bacterium]
MADKGRFRELLNGNRCIKVMISRKRQGVSFEDLFSRMKEVIVKKELYLDSNFSRTLLAREVGSNRTYVTKALNAHGVGFYDYLNRYRLERAKQILSQKENSTMLMEEVACGSGFSSVRKMNYCMVQSEGITASQYRKRLLKR